MTKPANPGPHKMVRSGNRKARRTALRELAALVETRILASGGGGRGAHYVLAGKRATNAPSAPQIAPKGPTGKRARNAPNRPGPLGPRSRSVRAKKDSQEPAEVETPKHRGRRGKTRRK